MRFRSAKRGLVMPSTLSRLAACVACLPAIPCLSLRALQTSAQCGLPVVAGLLTRGESSKKGEALSVPVASRLTVCMLLGLSPQPAHALPAPLASHTRRVAGCWQVLPQVEIHKFLSSVEPPGHALS